MRLSLKRAACVVFICGMVMVICFLGLYGWSKHSKMSYHISLRAPNMIHQVVAPLNFQAPMNDPNLHVIKTRGQLQSENVPQPDGIISQSKDRMDDPYVAVISTKGKTKVLKHDGVKFDRLYEFCTWTLDFDCYKMKTPVGRIPFYIQAPGTDYYMTSVLAHDQERDPGEMAMIMHELRALSNPMFVDIGANLGAHSMVIAKTLQIPVLSVDPLVENVVRLCKTIQENNLTDNVTIIFNALDDKYEKVGLLKPPKHLEASKVTKFNDTYIGGPNSCVKPTSAMTCKLDDLLPLMTSKSAVLKLDVEAHEYKVLHGGQRFLETIDVRAIFMEWDNVKKTPDGKLLVDFLRERNYVPYYADNTRTKGAQLEFDKYLTWSFSVIWVKKQ